MSTTKMGGGITHEDAAHEVRAEIFKAFPGLDPQMVRVDVLAGASMVDVTFPAYQAAKEWANIEVKVESSSPFTVPFGNHAQIRYGLSIVTKDSGFETKPDCVFAHLPTLIQYLKRLFPAQAGDQPAQTRIAELEAGRIDAARALLKTGTPQKGGPKDTLSPTGEPEGQG